MKQRILLTLVWSVVSAGCQGGDAENGGGEEGLAEIRTYAAAELPKLGDYLPAFDGGRVEIAPPAGWKVLPRSAKYLVRFYETDPNGFPRIEVTVRPCPFSEIQNVKTEDDARRLAKLLAADFQQQGKTLIEPVRPMMLGGTPCVRYVRGVTLQMRREGRISRLSVERQILETVFDGRMYTVDLRVLPGTMLQSNKAGYAVCAGLKFKQPQSQRPAADAGASEDGGASDEEPPDDPT